MMKVVLMLAAATAALLVAQRALATRRSRREKDETNGEIKRWEDEGGNHALLASGMDDTFGP